MSLFQSRVWWAGRIPGEEMDGTHHLAVGKFGGREDDRIVVGSFAGKIRIFEPREGGFKPQHLVLERDESKPILQLIGFKFTPDGAEMLAILFARGFIVYSFHQGQEGLLLKNEAREESTDRLAHNMCQCFIAGEGLLCVQSQEGLVSFYNRSSRTCAFQLPDTVLPSPLLFLHSKSLLLTQNAVLGLTAFRYNSLYGSTAGASTGVKPEWEATLGELALSIDVTDSVEDPLVVVGCEQHIYVVRSSSGKIDQLKRLQCVPSCVLVNTFKTENPKDLVLVVSSFSHHILFYKNFELAWATKTANVAHGIRLGTFGKKKGMIVSLNEEGHIDVLYLGVDVPELKFQSAVTRDQSYDDLKKEAARLRGKICLPLAEIQSKANEVGDSGTSNQERLTINCQMLLKNEMNPTADSGSCFASEIGTVVSSVIKVSLGFSGNEATTVSLIIKAPEVSFNFMKAVILKQNHFNIDRVKGGGTPAVVETDFYIDNTIPLTEQNIEITAIFEYYGGTTLQTGSAYKTMPLSLETYCYLVSPVKEADFKLTLEANMELPPLNEIFKDFIETTKPDPQYYSNPNALSFLLNEGSICTLILAKASNKLRVQGSNFDSLYLILNELISRRKVAVPGFRLQYNDSLPLKDLFDILDERKTIATDQKKVLEDLVSKTNQLLFIQKRLLARYKDNSASNLNNLDVLLEASVAELISLTKDSEKLGLFFKKNSQKVTISFKMLITLLSMRFPISEDGMALLNKYLPTYVESSVQEVGWVEIMDLNIFYLLKSVLLGKDDGSLTAYAPIDNLEVFQQHFTLLVDKISKGVLANYKFPKEEVQGNPSPKARA